MNVRVLWIVNIVFPFPSRMLEMPNTVFGGWLLSLMKELKDRKEISKIAVATVYNGKDLKVYNDGNIIYYMLPCKNKEKYDKKLELYWKQVLNLFEPDIVHIHGTEYPHSLAFLNINSNVKSCVSVQGLVSECGKKEFYNARIKTIDLLTNVTLRDIIKNDILIFQHYKFLKRGKFEISILKKSNFVIGRTSWDRAHVYRITLKNNYTCCNESLRQEFYNKKWDIKNIERHSIFVSQASYPLKGFHTVIYAASILATQYSDLKIYVAGNDVIKQTSSKMEKIKISGYGKYIKKLIKKYHLTENIKFLGLLDAEAISKQLLKANVYLQASFMENSSNSLGEAMLVGVPCVASYVGGTSDMLLDKTDGLLYPVGDYSMIAKYVSDIFDDDNLAVSLGQNAKKHAHVTHSLSTNANKMIDIYKNMI